MAGVMVEVMRLGEAVEATTVAWAVARAGCVAGIPATAKVPWWLWLDASSKAAVVHELLARWKSAAAVGAKRHDGGAAGGEKGTRNLLATMDGAR